MKTKKEINQEEFNSIKNLKYTINPQLDKYDDLILFPEKLRKAKAHLAKVGMPKEYYEQMARQKEEEK